MGARQFARGMKTGLQPYLEQRRRDIAADSDFERSQKAADIQYGRQKESATTLSDRNKERDTIRFGRKLEAAQFSSDLTFKSKQELDKYKHDTRMKGIAAAQAEYDKTGDPSVFAEYLPDKYKNLWSKENMTKYQAESLKGQKTRDQAYIERLKDQGNEKESKRIERLWARAKAYPQMIDDPKDKEMATRNIWLILVIKIAILLGKKRKLDP